MLDVRFQSAETPLPKPKGGWARAPFKASWSKTLGDLERELGHLQARDIVIIADMPREAIRLDGWPRSTATARTPGVTITFESKHGPLRYDCGTYNHWESNIRAFALTLERLRAIDRYGCTQGEQYAGWRALPPAAAKQAGGFANAEEAAGFILRMGGYIDEPAARRSLIDVPVHLRTHYRDAARLLHPDVGGSAEQMARLNAARDLIEGAS